MALPWGRLVLGAAVVFAASIARAEPRVVIVQTRDAPPLPGLASQVLLHAGEHVTLDTIDADATSLAFASRAPALVAAHAATIVVWVAAIEGSEPGHRTFAVFAAGRFPGRALLELVRLDASTPAGEVERTIALKISGLLDTIVTAKPIGAALGVSAQRIASWRIELAGTIVRERGDRELDGSIAAALDRRWGVGSWAVALGAALHWQPSSTISAARGTVAIDEAGPAFALAVERTAGPVTFYVRPQLSAAWLYARGTSFAGPRGSAIVWSPSVGAEVGVRWLLSDSVELIVAGGVDWALTRQQFLVDGELAADLGHVRGLVTFGLSLPLR